MPSDSSFGPTSALVTAALAGLLGLTAACSSDAQDPAGSKAPATSPDGGEMEPGEITSSGVDETMTLEKFTADCDTRGGVIETHPSCHGANTCKGLSYDDATHVLTEHTCAGLNTCSGYSCVVPM